MVPKPERDRKQYWLNLTLAGAAGQVGCVTLIIILVAILGGLWLDAQFNTRPMFTLVLLLASIPISLAIMLYLVRLATSKIKAGPPGVEVNRSLNQPPDQPSDEDSRK